MFLRTLFLLLLYAGPLLAAEAPRPNILFILTDDLGYGDVGVFFQNQRRAQNDRSQPWHMTPQLDAMAAQGLQLRQYYCAAPVCAPSRASLLSGLHQGHANVRDNQFDKALEENHTLASVLKGAGYATAAFGKWGLQGGPGEKDPAGAKAGPDQWPAFPTRRGFDYYLGYARHVDGHFHYPKEDERQLWDNERNISSDVAGCYTTDLFAARAKKWIVDQHTSHPEQPFFIYLAFDTPHAKLQLPPSPFPAGSGLKGGLQWLGERGHMLNSAGEPDSYMHPDYANATWDDDHNPATPEVPWPDVYKRYATDVRRIDDCVGDLRALLRDLGLDGNTLVIFTSDNGPSRESYLPEAYKPTFFHSFGPMDGIKRDCWEAGIRVGALAQWPAAIKPGGVSELPTQAHDWLPTFADLAGVPAPARADGVSLAPTLTGSGTQKPPTVYVEYFVTEKTPDYAEFEAARRGAARKQMQAIRMGDFMGVRYRIASHADPFEIYNVATDPKEVKNLAAERPDLQAKMHDAVLQLRRPDASAPRPYDGELVPPSKPEATQPGVAWHAYTSAMPWLARLEDLAPAKSGASASLTMPAVPGTTALLFSGWLRVPADGAYTFTLPAGATALLRLHEATVIDAAFAPAATETTGSIRLAAGLHPFRLYWRTAPGAPAPQLTWAPEGAAPQPIPANALLR